MLEGLVSGHNEAKLSDVPRYLRHVHMKCSLGLGPDPLLAVSQLSGMKCIGTHTSEALSDLCDSILVSRLQSWVLGFHNSIPLRPEGTFSVCVRGICQSGECSYVPSGREYQCMPLCRLHPPCPAAVSGNLA